MISSHKLVFCVILFTISCISSIYALKEGECEVCIATVNKFVDQLDEAVKKDPKKIEEDFRKFCKKSKGKENRFVSSTENCLFRSILDDV